MSLRDGVIAYLCFCTASFPIMVIATILLQGKKVPIPDRIVKFVLWFVFWLVLCPVWWGFFIKEIAGRTRGNTPSSPSGASPPGDP